MQYRGFRLLVLVLALVGLVAAWGGQAQADSTGVCPDAGTDTSACGPVLTLPQWSSSGGWTEPQYYSTIQTADLNGDGKAELLARGEAGLQVYTFDPAAGQWQLTPQDPGIVLTDVSDSAGWAQPQYYSTLQTADLDGDGQAELLGRGTGGLVVWKWNKATQTFTQLGPPLAAMADSGGWTDPQYYSTIQTADVNGDGTDEVIARFSDGIHVFDWEPGTEAGWTDLQHGQANPALSTPTWSTPDLYSTIQTGDVDGDGAADLIARDYAGHGIDLWKWSKAQSGFVQIPLEIDPAPTQPYWQLPAYYSTIQTGDVDGDGAAELLARGPDGLMIWKYYPATQEFLQLGSTISYFADAGNWSEAEYDTTIQTARFDAARPAAEILARGAEGMVAFAWNGSSWQQTVTNEPSLSDPLWSDPSLYSTIQTADIDGNGVDDLLGRGPYGLRTWTFDSASQSFVRPQPYGNYPQFSGEEADAYDALNAFLGPSMTEPTVRQEYCVGVPAAECAPNYDNLGFLLGDLTKNCNQLTGVNPPTYATCTPPPGSNVSTAAWTAVANEIIAELFWAQAVIGYFTGDEQSPGIETMANSLFELDNGDLPDIVNDLQLTEAAHLKVSASPGDAVASGLDAIGELVDTFGGEETGGLATGLELAADVLGGVMDASTLSGPSVAEEYTQISEDVQSAQSTLVATTQAQQTLALGDYGFLRTIGYLAAKGVYNINLAAARSAGEEGFATWVYQLLLPKIWARYVVSDCKDEDYVVIIHSCHVPPSGDYMESRSGDNFTAILDQASACATSSGVPVNNYCSWILPADSLVNVIWGQTQSECTFDGTGNTWRYTIPNPEEPLNPIHCNLQIPSGELFNNEEGWSFPTYYCKPGACSSSAARAGLVGARITSGVASGLGHNGQVGFTGSMTGVGDVALDGATVQVQRVLFDGQTGEELVRDRNGGYALPVTLVERTARAGAATFSTALGGRPRMVLWLTKQGADLGLSFSANGISLRDPTCTGAPPTATLAPRILLRERGGDTLIFDPAATWECRHGILRIGGGSTAG
jgi:FG-GAP-like repeat